MADGQDKLVSKVVCTRCKLEILDSDDYIVSRCNGQGCGEEITCHQRCIEEMLLKSNMNKATSQSAAQQKRQNKLAHAPHAALKAQPCPREGCTGRVQDTDRVMQTKRKKTLEASLAAPAAIPVPAPKPSGKGRKTHKAPGGAEASGPPAPGQPSPVIKQKLQLNVPAKSDVVRHPNAAGLPNMPGRVKVNRNLNPYASLATVNEDEEEADEEEEANQATKQPASEADLGPSIEEVDAAIRLGHLPDDFNTSWCNDFFDKGSCPRGRHCKFAHTLQQLRIDAGIEKGTIQPAFKTNFCANMASNGYCPHGVKCQHAHSAEELRVSVLIQSDVLDEEYHIEFCQSLVRGGTCAIGLACGGAHNRAELRAEAAVLHEKQNDTYRFALCENWYRRGTCSRDIGCEFAHGIDEVRVCSATHFHELQPNYKTQRCTRPKCDAPWKCHYYHSDADRRKHMKRKTVYCPIWKELGGCAMGDRCHWAHGPEDLDVRAFNFDFPLAAEEHKQGDWEQIEGRKPSSVRTGKQKGRQADGSHAFSSKGAPASGHQASFHPREAKDSVPMSVQLNKMPAQPETVRRRSTRGGKKTRKSAASYKLCVEFEEKGHCKILGCEYAHGQDMLDKRRMEKEGKSAAQKGPRINLATASLSTASIQHLKNRKLDLCTAHLTEMGFKGHRDAARMMGGEPDAAVELIMQLRSRPAQALEVDVQGEIASAISMAHDSNWSLPYLEEQIKQHKGDVNAIFHEQVQAVESAASSSGGWTPRSEASTSVAGTPHTPWQEEAALQVDRSGKAVKVDADGFPDVASLDLETDQNQLRYEAYQAMAAQRTRVSLVGGDGSADTPPGRTHAWEQGRPSSSSSSRTPFADSRPQTDRFDEAAAARASARTSDSLAAMGVPPSMVVSGSGPIRAAPQAQGFAAMAPPLGMLGPPPPFQRNALRQPPLSSNANAHAGSSSSADQSDAGNGYGYGQSPPFAAAARSPSGPAAEQSHRYAAQAAADFPSDIFGPIQHGNGIAAHPDPKQAQRGGQFHSESQAQPMPKAGDWNKELWATNSDRSAPGFSWIQQQQQQNTSSGQQNGQSQSQQRHSAGPGFEQMPPIPAQHAAAATRQKAAPAPAPAQSGDVTEWVFF
ncbi:hypothetical protein WJX77_012125 [Trebouxia sp. C0004]